MARLKSIGCRVGNLYLNREWRGPHTAQGDADETPEEKTQIAALIKALEDLHAKGETLLVWDAAHMFGRWECRMIEVPADG